MRHAFELGEGTRWAWRSTALQASPKVLGVEPGVFQDAMEESQADRFASMDGNNRGSAVRVPEEAMTSLRANDLEPSALKHGQNLFACRPGKPCQDATVTRWTPTKSSSAGGAPPTSRQSWIASRIRFVSSSCDRACV